MPGKTRDIDRRNTLRDARHLRTLGMNLCFGRLFVIRVLFCVASVYVSRLFLQTVVVSNSVPLFPVSIFLDVGVTQGLGLGTYNRYRSLGWVGCAPYLGMVQVAHGFEPQIVGFGRQG